MSPWAWVAIGCGGIVVLGVVAFLALGYFAVQKGKEMVEETTGSGSFEEFVQDMQDNPAKTAAELAVRMNPDLELVSTDDEAGTITFTNTKTGEQATLNFEDIAEGRFSMTTDEGEYSIDASDAVEGGEGGITFSGPEGETRIGGSVDLEQVPDWVPAYPGATGAQSTMHSSSADTVWGAFTAKTNDDAQTVIDHFKKVFEENGYTIGTESMNKTGDGSYGALTGKLDGGRELNVVVLESGGESQVTINYSQKSQ